MTRVEGFETLQSTSQARETAKLTEFAVHNEKKESKSALLIKAKRHSL